MSRFAPTAIRCTPASRRSSTPPAGSSASSDDTASRLSPLPPDSYHLLLCRGSPPRMARWREDRLAVFVPYPFWGSRLTRESLRTSTLSPERALPCGGEPRQRRRRCPDPCFSAFPFPSKTPADHFAAKA